MASSQRDRLRRLAQKAARRKSIVAEKRKTDLAATASNLADRVRRAAKAPLETCIVSAELFERGFGQLTVARSLPSGQVAVAFFLLDPFCLGVKDVFFREMTRDEFAFAQESAAQVQTFVEIDPGQARRLVKESAAYAGSLGLRAPGDLSAVEAIFGEFPATDGDAFVFGRDGKPLYMPGPSDTPAKARRIMATLTRHLGPDGFHVVAPIMGPEYEELDETEDFEEEEFLEGEVIEGELASPERQLE
jgi:hypothetical protein